MNKQNLTCSVFCIVMTRLQLSLESTDELGIWQSSRHRLGWLAAIFKSTCHLDCLVAIFNGTCHLRGDAQRFPTMAASRLDVTRRHTWSRLIWPREAGPSIIRNWSGTSRKRELASNYQELWYLKYLVPLARALLV